MGAGCPLLKSDGKHGTWTFAVDLKSLDGHRKTLRRSGFPTERKAKDELKKVTDRARTSVKNDDRETVAQYLRLVWDQRCRDRMAVRSVP